MKGTAMSAALSPLRWRLCSKDHAARVAGRLVAAGERVEVVPGTERLQPWRVIEGRAAGTEEGIACA